VTRPPVSVARATAAEDVTGNLSISFFSFFSLLSRQPLLFEILFLPFIYIFFSLQARRLCFLFLNNFINNFVEIKEIG
jgi:hypothetical protein